MSTEPATSVELKEVEGVEKIEKVDYIRAAQIAFVEKGKHKPFVFAVYEHGTIVVWLDPKNEGELSPYEITRKANEYFAKFPGFTPGTPDADFRVIFNEEMFGDLSEKVYFVTYDHNLPYMSCIIGDMSDIEAGLKARENFEKDFQKGNCIYTCANIPLPP